MKQMNIVRLLVIVALLSVFSGCKESPLEFSIRYDTLGDLKPNAPVYFEETPVGKVEKIVSTEQGDYLVEVSIALEHKGKATENSKFFILSDPLDSKREAVVIEQDPPGGAVLKDGSIVQGEKRLGCFDSFMHSFKKSTKEASTKLQEAMQEWKKALAESSRNFDEELNKSLDDLDRYLQDSQNSQGSLFSEEDLEQLQQAIKEFIEEFKRSSADIQKQLRENVLPQLRRNLENLREQLLDQGRKDDARDIDGQINQLVEV